MDADASISHGRVKTNAVRNLILAGVLSACIGAFVWTLEAVRLGLVTHIDHRVEVWAAAHRTPQLTEVALNLTALGSGTLLTVATVLVFMLLWTAKRRLAAIDAAVASFVASVATDVVKTALQRPRPMITHLTTATSFSFPSGHTSGIAALLTVTALHTVGSAQSRAQRVVLICAHALLLFAVAWSRIYLGVHYLSDVCGGVCVGAACALLSHGIVRSPSVVRYLRTRLR